MFIIVAIIVCILGYGYWHSSTHASFYIQLGFKDIAKEPKTIPKAEIIFMDSEKRVLARGIEKDAGETLKEFTDEEILLNEEHVY